MKINRLLFAICFLMGPLNSVAWATDTADTPPVGDYPTLAIDHWQTSNGSSIYFVQTPEIPILDVKVIFNAGSARDTGLAGVAWLTNAMLDEGTTTLSADQLAAQFDELGAQIGTYAMRDMAIVEMRTLTDENLLNKAVSLTYDLINNPRFSEKSLLQIKNQVLVSLEKQRKLPASLAERAFWSTAYQNHPYANPIQGTEKSLAKIDRQALLNFYQRFYVGANATMALVGNIDKIKARQISERLLGDLPTGQEAPPLPMPSTPSVDQNVSIAFPSTQTHILIGMPLLKRADPDYIPLTVANHILGGGGFGSILMESIREKRGLAYSIDSTLSAMQAPGPFDITLQTKNTSSTEATQIIQQELKNFIAQGPTDEQLTHAKQEIIGQQPLSIASNDAIATYIAMLGFYNLPLDYYDQFKNGIQNLNAEEIKKTLQAHFDLKKLTVVTVGNPGEN